MPGRVIQILIDVIETYSLVAYAEVLLQMLMELDQIILLLPDLQPGLVWFHQLYVYLSRWKQPGTRLKIHHEPNDENCVHDSRTCTQNWM